MALSVGEFFDKHGGSPVGYLHSSSPVNGDNQTVTVYQDRDGQYWVESPNGVSYIGDKPKSWRVFENRLDAKAGPVVASWLRADGHEG